VKKRNTLCFSPETEGAFTGDTGAGLLEADNRLLSSRVP